MLASYIAAEAAVLKGLSYRIGDLALTRANLNEIIAGRKEWERKVAAENEVALGRQPGVALADFGSHPRIYGGYDFEGSGCR
jgi:hypothetical protein